MWIILNNRASLAEVRTDVAGDFAILNMQGRRQTLAVLVAEITSRTLMVGLCPVASVLTKCPARVCRKWMALWIAGNFRVRREATRCYGIGSVDSPCRCPDAAIGAEETLRDPSPSGVDGAGAPRVPCSASLWA